MATKTDTTKQLESMLGLPAGDRATKLRPDFWSPVCTYDFEDQTGFVTWMNLIVALPKHCDPVSLLDVTGSGFTGDDGKRVFRLSWFICLQNQLLQPANVVATPQSASPCYLTILHTLVDNAMDLEITVSTWDAGGAPAPGVGFDWRCRVPYWVPVLKGTQPGCG
jgi:hypothetical protein